MLEDEPDIEVVGEASDGAEAVEKAAELHPAVVVMDFAMPSMNGAVAARHILDRKSTRLNSSHLGISYAVFCLKKKKYKHQYIGLADQTSRRADSSCRREIV